MKAFSKVSLLSAKTVHSFNTGLTAKIAFPTPNNFAASLYPKLITEKEKINFTPGMLKPIATFTEMSFSARQPPEAEQIFHWA